MRFLIDECLCHDLVEVARDEGYDAHHVDWLKLKGTKDPKLMPRIIDESFTFVTNNAADFRRLFAREDLHAGLVILLPSVKRALQVELFEAVLAELRAGADLFNTLIEADFVDASAGGDVTITRSALSA